MPLKNVLKNDNYQNKTNNQYCIFVITDLTRKSGLLCTKSDIIIQQDLREKNSGENSWPKGNQTEGVLASVCHGGSSQA